MDDIFEAENELYDCVKVNYKTQDIENILTNRWTEFTGKIKALRSRLDALDEKGSEFIEGCSTD